LKVSPGFLKNASFKFYLNCQKKTIFDSISVYNRHVRGNPAHTSHCFDGLHELPPSDYDCIICCWPVTFQKTASVLLLYNSWMGLPNV